MKKINLKSSVEDVDEKGQVKIRVSAFGNVDSYGDIVDEKAFNQTISVFKSSQRSRIKHLQDHNWSKLVGLPIEITKTSEGLDIVSKMNIEKQFVKDIFSDYKFMADNGNTLEHSIGYVVVKEEKSKANGGANILKELDLKEYSSLSFLGANGETPLLDIKSLIEKGEYSEEKVLELKKKISMLEDQVKSLEQFKGTPTDEGINDKEKPSIILLF
jgi:hypothetical protein